VAFPKKLLNAGEQLHVDLRPHWWYFSRNAATLLLSIVLLVVARTQMEDGNGRDAVVLVLAVLTVLSLVWFVARYLKWMTTNFAVTSERVIFRQGVIAKKGIEIPLDRVNTIFFNQGIFERMIGAGDLTIESAGSKGSENFTDIRRPSKVQNEIYRLMEDEQARNRGNTTVERELSIPEQITQLDDLRKKGLIDDTEFQAKKTKLLERM
jgi:uncharacterized membrane protein YdbT with pleckstrin-like domain